MERKTDSNPYTAPGIAPASGSIQGPGVDFAPILRRWERLRLFYNGILVSLVLLVTFTGFPEHILVSGYWVSLVLGGILANLCFLTGPAIEAYGTYFELWNRVMTTLLFLAGLLLTAILAVGSIASF